MKLLGVLFAASLTQALCADEPVPQDPREALIDELEDHFLSPQIKVLRERDAKKLLEFVAPTYVGVTLLDLGDEPQQRHKLGAGEEMIWGVHAETLDNRAVSQKWAGILERLERVDECLLKFKSIETDDPKRATGQLKVRLDGVERGGAVVCYKAVYAATLSAASGAWRWESLQRVSATVTRAPRTLFAEVTARTGIRLEMPPAEGQLPYAGSERLVAVSGGVLVGDYDGDGFDDVLLTSWAGVKLYHNLGNGKFEDATERAGLKLNAGFLPTGGIFFDYDNDGREDLLLTGVARKESDGSSLRLFHNVGGGKFEDVTMRSDLARLGPAMSACAADIDRDGFLDVYVCYYGSGHDPHSLTQAKDGVPNVLFRNRGDGTFEEIGATAGVNNPGWSLAASFGDYNDDGWPDLLVTNDYGLNALYKNNGNRTFSDVTEKSGGAAAGFGMGVCWGDFDHDGRLDVFVTKMSSTAGKRIFSHRDPTVPDDAWTRLFQTVNGSSLLRNNGDGTFTDVAKTAAVDDANWAWGGQFLDYNNDGWLDIYAPNGFISGRFKKDT